MNDRIAMLIIANIWMACGHLSEPGIKTYSCLILALIFTLISWVLSYGLTEKK